MECLSSRCHKIVIFFVFRAPARRSAIDYGVIRFALKA
jgi:hypothetical protein